MAGQVTQHAGKDWWQSDEGIWFSRMIGTEEWTQDSTNIGPGGVVKGIDVLNTETGTNSTITLSDPGERFRVIESVTSHDGTIVEILEYKELLGSSDVRTAELLYFTTNAGAKLKMVRIRLSGSKVRVEPGALYFMKGQLEMKTSTGGGIFKGMKRKMLSGETFFVNEIHGIGEVYLEPTFGHFFLQNINQNNPGLVCDKGMFYAGAGDMKISAKMQGKLSAGFFGGEGWFQTHISGNGIAILYVPVPKEEIMRYTLNDEKLSVDGNFALMRDDTVQFKVEKSSKGIMGSLVSGEGFLQTFSGRGNVWIAPTQGVYEKLTSQRGMRDLANNPASMGTMVKLGKKKR
jgi:uncharacterized protein (TIGR00266 family)|tara:strand:- start:1351 stop:2388 length:1038 start_codon:yes stop_codon:yes gene_type:complete